MAASTFSESVSRAATAAAGSAALNGTVWITRDALCRYDRDLSVWLSPPDNYNPYVEFPGNEAPHVIDGGRWRWLGATSVKVNATEFEKLTGVVILPGQAMRATLAPGEVVDGMRREVVEIEMADAKIATATA